MRLILFCDYGLDDALATADVLLYVREGYSGVDLVAVGGNVPAEVALVNAKKLLARFSPALPVRIVDTTAERQPSEFLKEVHGNDGMGDLFAETDVPALPFAEWLRGLDEEYDLLSLGPMTLVPRLLDKGGCRRFLFMGGNIAEEPNFHGYEFNHALNRAAFTQATQNHPHIAITMDTCRHPLFNIQDKEIEGDGTEFLIARRLRELNLQTGEKGCYVWDDIAVRCLRFPALFATEQRTDCDGNLLTVARYCGEKSYLSLLGR